jgi:hypothetical protein
MGLYAALATTDLARASPPFETDVIEIANAGGVRIIAVAEYGDIDQVRRRGILPDLGIDAREVDLLVKPAANPVVTGIGNEVRETADVFVFLRVQPIAQITPWRASRRDLSQTEETAAPGDPRLRACVRRGDCGLAIRPPREHRISDEVDIDMPKQHRRAVMGFEPHARHAPVPKSRGSARCVQGRVLECHFPGSVCIPG